MNKSIHRLRKPPAAKPARGFLRRAVLTVTAVVGLASFLYGDMLAIDYYREELSPVVTVQTDHGGWISNYVDQYEGWRAKGRQVRIDGTCISACTLAIGLIDADHLCATAHGTFAFHSAFYYGPHNERIFAPSETRAVWHIYPPELRKWLAEHGFDGEGDTANHPQLLYLEGADVYQFVRKCD